MGETLSARVRAILDDQKIRPTELVKVAGVSKGLVSQWLNDQRVKMSYEAAQKIHRKYGYGMDWLMTGRGSKTNGAAEPQPLAYADLTAQEADLVTRYRAADPRWQLSLRLIAALGTEEQLEFASDVNMIVARLVGMKPKDLRYPPDAEVAKKLGKAKHVIEREQKERTRK